jgi:hypothetical protein
MRLSLLLSLAVLAASCASSRAPRQFAEEASQPNPMLARSAGLGVEREHPEEGPPKAAALAKGFGGWVQRSSRTNVVLQVPEPKLDDFLATVPNALGAVTRKELRAADVGDQYRDDKIRLDNLERARQRYLELLTKAANVTEAIAVEKELERLTVQIESLKARLQSLEARVAFAAVDIDFDKPSSPGPVGWVFYGLYRGVKWLFVWD